MRKAVRQGCDGTTVLKVLVSGGPCTLDTLCRAIFGKPQPVNSNGRKNIRTAIGRLIKNDLAISAQPAQQTFPINHAGVTFDATAAGRKFIADGKTLTGGPKGPNSGAPVAKNGSDLRQRFWNALRMKEKATLVDVVELAHRDDDPDPVKVTANARRYFDALERAGIVKRLGVKAAGIGPHSRGHIRFALLKDLGGRAPLAGRTFLTNLNAPVTEARIAYAERKKK